MTGARRALVPVALLALVTACSSGADEKPSSAPDPSPSASVAEPAPTPVQPVVGGCHELTLSEATDPVDSAGPVPCTRPHTSVTMKVGQLRPVMDGHLLAVDSRTVRAQIAQACPDSPGALVGGDPRTQRLSRFEVVWFSPSLGQADAGANWYRCDVVALRSQGQLLPLPARLEGVLDRRGALDRFGTCGTAPAPSARGFERVVCSERHRSRAIEVVDLPRNARYLARSVEAMGNAACRDAASERSEGGLKITWTFEWPTQEQWAAGQRYGYCWVPET